MNRFFLQKFPYKICSNHEFTKNPLFFNFYQIPFPDENLIVQNATYHLNGTYYGLYAGLQKLSENLYPNYSVDYTTGNEVTFAVVFGVLFSGVTGRIFLHLS